jgi:CRP/FNR family transcriptional regulator, cyclic AMP receptor protein
MNGDGESGCEIAVRKRTSGRGGAGLSPHWALPARGVAIIATVSDREQSAVELLKSVPLFADLDEAELERFSHVAVPRAYPAGTRVFHEGDSSDACYIVRDGSFRITREHSDGRAITLATLGPGEIFGELAMLDGDKRSASAEALSDGEVLALPAGDVRSLLARHPEIALKLVAGLVRRLRAANVRLSRQSFQTVPSRVAGILAQLSREAQDEDGGPGEEVTIRMNQTDLAQLAGTSRESVSRFLAELERAGVVRSGRGRVTVLDPPKLRNYIY